MGNAYSLQVKKHISLLTRLLMCSVSVAHFEGMSMSHPGFFLSMYSADSFTPQYITDPIAVNSSPWF